MGNLPVLARLRGRRGWSARDLWRESGVTPETISRIEHGLMPGAAVIGKLAIALEIDFDELHAALLAEHDTEEASA